MKTKITAFINSLGVYDYLVFGGSFVVFILFIILALILRKKIVLAIFLILFAFAALFLVPTFGRELMYSHLYKNTVSLTSQKKLQFSDAIVVKGTLKNDSKRNFKRCKINIKVHKVSKNKLKNYLFQFKIIKNISLYKESISKGQEITFKAIVEPFTYKKDYNITIGADCR